MIGRLVNQDLCQALHCKITGDLNEARQDMNIIKTRGCKNVSQIILIYQHLSSGRRTIQWVPTNNLLNSSFREPEEINQKAYGIPIPLQVFYGRKEAKKKIIINTQDQQNIGSKSVTSAARTQRLSVILLIPVIVVMKLHHHRIIYQGLHLHRCHLLKPQCDHRTKTRW